MEITLKKIDGSSPELPAVLELYESAFPANERREPEEIIGGENGAGELLAVMSGGALCGMLAVLTYRDITHILYFAVMPERRNSGIGAAALEALRERYPGRRIIADLERPEPGTPNREQRLRRLAFYERCGYYPTEVKYRWRGEDYVIVASGGAITEREFGGFWRHFHPERRKEIE
ncbi:MAG: GNAT family N-acetyltransferase [Oscillospiraceae bacterium]|nr:GNAT family N-acetyltransferase [Oscillospiraceae bacterium]